jgi:hypothetical protein
MKRGPGFLTKIPSKPPMVVAKPATAVSASATPTFAAMEYLPRRLSPLRRLR